MSKQQQLQMLLAVLQPEHLEIHNESHMHSRGVDTHYKAVIVSSVFEGLSAVKRHQRVYASLGALMSQLHALALHTYTPEEWRVQGTAPASPVCGGGAKHGH